MNGASRPTQLTWGANAGEVLEVPDAALIASGSAYARLVDQRDGRARFDAVMNAGMKDDGAGVPYQVQYALRPTPDSAPLHWIEDIGRWFAGSDGTPARAHGIVRVIELAPRTGAAARLSLPLRCAHQ